MSKSSSSEQSWVLNLCDSHLESLAKWLSCNGEIWGVGPTAVFASAAALFLYNELESTIFIAGDHAHVSAMEKTLVSTMVMGMLALMIHLWVCSMRFFQYYLDTLIRDSPNILLEMTTAGLLGGQDVMPLGPLTKFLKQQQPQIHITVCWFLSLCYADYVRKHYCTRFNMPYLEQWLVAQLPTSTAEHPIIAKKSEYRNSALKSLLMKAWEQHNLPNPTSDTIYWQTELHERATTSVYRTMQKVHSFVASAQQRLRGYAQPAVTPSPSEIHTVRARLPRERRWKSAEPPAGCRGARCPAVKQTTEPEPKTGIEHVCGSSANRAKQLLTLLRNLEHTSRQLDVPVRVHKSPGFVTLTHHVKKPRSLNQLPPLDTCGDF